MDSQNAITVHNLSKTFRVKEKEKGLRGSIKSMFHPRYKTIKAVEEIDFTVKQGEILAFIGPNGAGKSTTIKMMTGILYPNAGEIKVLGLNPTKKRKQLAYQIGTVFGQKEQLWTHLTPYDNFQFFTAVYDIPATEGKKRIEEMIEVFELEEFVNTPVRNLSLGQRIRCEIVASLIHNPKILFLDEPTIGLDPVVKEKIRELIKRLNREFGTTIFLTSHDVGDIEKLCKRIIIVNHGKIVLDDSMERLKYHYLNQKVVELKLRDDMVLPQIKGVTVLKQKDTKAKLLVELNETSIGEVMSQLSMEMIEDLNISNVPLENIITTIYKESGANAQ